jgi:hypothetical protein
MPGSEIAGLARLRFWVSAFKFEQRWAQQFVTASSGGKAWLLLLPAHLGPNLTHWSASPLRYPALSLTPIPYQRSRLSRRKFAFWRSQTGVAWRLLPL